MSTSLGSLIHSSTGSTCDISRRSAITRAAIQSLENQIWRSRLAISTKLKLYNTCILPIFLYGSDCWAISKTDKWYQFVRNDDVRRLTKQPKLTAIIQSCRLTLFGHIMRVDNNADAKRILLASPPADCTEKTTRSSPHHVAQHRPTGSETTPPYAPRSSRFRSEPPSVEDDVDVWRYAIVSCMPETTTTRTACGGKEAH